MKKGNKNGKLIFSKTFRTEDQNQFAKFSGDRNPIHTDPVVARRTIAGECIVHGIHGLMWGLNELLTKYDNPVSSFTAEFLKPITLDIKVYLYWEVKKNKLTIANENTIFTIIYVEFGDVIIGDMNSSLEVGDPFNSPINISLKQCTEMKKRALIFRGDIDLGISLFPVFFKKYGNIIGSEMAATSEIIGMQVPGLNSLFLSISGTFAPCQEDPSFEVEDYDLRFGILKIKMQGKFLYCHINALYRPCSSKPPPVSALKKLVDSDNFASINALIIGGSRGLGEVTAKLIASGGGKVTITYNFGKEDAKQIQKEIIEGGSSCDVVCLSVTNSYELPQKNFNQIYYFPTPKIKSEDSNLDPILLDQYRLFYVDAFKSLVDKIIKKNDFIKIFYPSSNFINNPSKKFLAYAMVKLEGEILCGKLNECENIKIMYPRLPRMDTDQTIGMLPEAFQDSIQVMLPFIRGMCND